MKISTRLSVGLFILCLSASLELSAQDQRAEGLINITERAAAERTQQDAIRPDRPLIGIYAGHAENGVGISSTADGGGAAAAGLEAGDVITAINGNALQDLHDLQRELSKYEGGQAVAVTYLRNGQSREASVTLKAKPNIRPDRPLIGIYPESNNGRGIRVDDITAGGGAVAAGIRSGDVITHLNGQPISGMTDLKAELSKYEGGDQVKVDFLRNGQTQSAEVTLQARGQNRHENVSRERDPCAVFIGVSLSGGGKEGQGVHVSGVIEDTPAREDGVLQGDDILALDGVEVNTFNELLYERNKHQPGERFTLTLLRDGAVIDIESRFRSCDRSENISETQVEEEIIADSPQDIIIDNSLKVEQWRAFPNPAFGSLNVQFQAAAVPTTVRLIDSRGRSVYREVMNRFDGYYDQQIDLSEVPPGNYFLQVVQGDEFVTEKIVVIPRA